MTLLKLFAGGAIACLLLLIVGSGYYYWTNHFNWYPDSFFINEFEKYTKIELESDAEVIWKWAAPRGADRKSHYVTAVIVAPAFDASRVNARFEPQTDCYKMSGGARRFLTEASSQQCWKSANTPNESEWFLILYAADENILLFKMNTE